MKMTKETFRRALRTFWQAFVGVLIGNIALLSAIDFEADTRTVVISICVQILAPALSAGLAALMNMEEVDE